MIGILPLLAAAAQASAPPAPAVPPAPPLATERRGTESGIMRFRAGEARCGGVSERPVHAEEPLPSGVAQMAWMSEMAAQPVVLRFRIDGTGRPLGIAPEWGQRQTYLGSSDLVPAFTAWQFRPGRERRECEIRFDVEPVAVARAEPSLLHRYVALVHPRHYGFNQEVSRAAYDRAKPAGSNCYDEPPPVRRQDFPAWDEMEQTPGRLAYTFFTFDLDRRGRPINVRLLSSTGHARLDAETRGAIERSRYGGGARRGCIFYYSLNPSRPLEAPPRPDRASLQDPAAVCPIDDDPWESKPELVFPPEFRRRSIEGWAYVRYDVAPWGQVGNVSVAAAEPTSTFGERALPIIAGARESRSPTGESGCVGGVLFKMGRRHSADPPARD